MISVITSTIRDSCIDNVFDNFTRQSVKDKELIIILNNDTMDKQRWYNRAKLYENVTVYQVNENHSLGYCLNYAIQKSKSTYIAKFDDDDYYGEHYLAQAYKAIKKEKDIGIVGKSAFYIFMENRNELFCVDWDGEGYTDKVSGATLFFKKDVWEQVKFRDRTYAEDYFFLSDCLDKGYKIYSTNVKHFVVIRRAQNDHTWKVNENELLQGTKRIPFIGHFSYVID